MTNSERSEKLDQEFLEAFEAVGEGSEIVSRVVIDSEGQALLQETAKNRTGAGIEPATCGL